MASAWITKEWTQNGRRRRKKVPPGMKEVNTTDRFVVEWIDPDGKRCREKISKLGRPGKRLADDLAEQLTSKLTLGQYDRHERKLWTDFVEEYEKKALNSKRTSTLNSAKESLTMFEKLCKPSL